MVGGLVQHLFRGDRGALMAGLVGDGELDKGELERVRAQLNDMSKSQREHSPLAERELALARKLDLLLEKSEL